MGTNARHQIERYTTADVARPRPIGTGCAITADAEGLMSVLGHWFRWPPHPTP